MQATFFVFKSLLLIENVSRRRGLTQNKWVEEDGDKRRFEDGEEDAEYDILAGNPTCIAFLASMEEVKRKLSKNLAMEEI